MNLHVMCVVQTEEVLFKFWFELLRGGYVGISVYDCMVFIGGCIDGLGVWERKAKTCQALIKDVEVIELMLQKNDIVMQMSLHLM